MEEYDLKIAFADSLRSLFAENSNIKSMLGQLRVYSDEIANKFDSDPEPKVLSCYLKEMTRCSKLFKHQLIRVSGSFNRLIKNIKKNSTIEKIFTYTDNESEGEQEANPTSDEGRLTTPAAEKRSTQGLTESEIQPGPSSIQTMTGVKRRSIKKLK